jgi:outer membrane protein OmpA-like peptidoglycan-associated protein
VDHATETTIEAMTPDRDRRRSSFWLLIGLALITLLYLVAWLATRYDGNESTTTPVTTTTAPTTSVAPTTTESSAAPTTTEVPTTTEAPTTTEPPATTQPPDVDPGTIADIATSGFGTLGSALDAAGLLETLDGPGPFTVLAPTTEAFAAVDAVTLETILADPEGLLKPTLLHHVFEGSYDRATLSEAGTTLTSLAGERVGFGVLGDELFVNDTILIAEGELAARNGVVFVIDGVLVPQGVSTVLTAGAISDLVALEPIQFDDSSATIKAESIPTLERAVEILAADPAARVEIGGHTDDVGPAEGNARLSVRRAEAVRDFLVEAGIDPQRLVAVGYGEDRPIADNTTDAGRATNRRIEFTPLDG